MLPIHDVPHPEHHLNKHIYFRGANVDALKLAEICIIGEICICIFQVEKYE